MARGRPEGVLRTVLLSTITLALVALVSSCGEDGDVGRAADHGTDEQFVGLVTEDAFARPGRYQRKALERQSRLGVQLLRQTFDWSLIEKRRGRYDFRRPDAFVRAAAAVGIRVLPILFRPPEFRSAAPRRNAARGTYPPRHLDDLGRFAQRLIRRYGPNGRIWRDVPPAERLPIRSWQIWNEPNLPVYWPPKPDPAAYAHLLRKTARAIRAADPGAEVVSAGVSDSQFGMPFEKFVKRFYAAGAKGSFDLFAVHPYARDAEGTLGAVELARDLMRTNGDESPIWITELGWASGGPQSPFTVGEAGQARRLRASISNLWGLRHALKIRGAVVFNWRDAPPYPGSSDFWGYHTGLLRRNGSAKPALRAFERTVAALR